MKSRLISKKNYLSWRAIFVQLQFFFIRSTGEFPKSLYAVNLLNAEDGGKHFFRAELLHLKAGGVGKCPILNAEKTLPSMLILLENKFAVLIDEKYFAEFEEKVLTLPEIETIFIIPDSNDGYISMIQNFRDRKTYPLYKILALILERRNKNGGFKTRGVANCKLRVGKFIGRICSNFKSCISPLIFSLVAEFIFLILILFLIFLVYSCEFS